MIAALAGCGSADWCVKYGKNAVSLKIYSYYVNTVYRQLADSRQIDPEASLSDQKIGDKSAKSYIYDAALEKVLYLCELTNRFEAAGLKIDGEMEKSLKTAAENEYLNGKELFDKMGVDADTVYEAGTSGKLGYMQQALFNSIYNTEGSKAVPDEEINTFFSENYVSYSYLYQKLTDEDGNPLDDAAKKAFKKELNDIVDKVKAGTLDIDDAANAYAQAYQEDNTCGKNGIATTTSSAADTEIIRRARALAPDEVVYLEIGDYAFVLQRHDLSKTQYAVDNRYSILVEMKMDEFTGEIMQAAQSAEYKVNEKNMKSAVSDLNKK